MSSDDDYLADHEDRERRWDCKARMERWYCSECGAVPAFNERQTYFETGMCGRCDFRSDKDD